ncbi:dipeptidyl aminopeptidase 1, putative [Plasmodium knowlesi strain H]|uniref:dipeptidyl-peptidase I n=3 Tax=Plasmodium knowlesi TaxID=5850 RepID=A0A5K1V7L1_PLAKH|nr:dipeptidyl aminopeptidase 1, putative [Plasmodium knowlesi strain H]OTN65231.1 putative Cathepsin c [Plasmodium knowlesi]CAA9988191.1 dipeptidyl aminopeptidase 1, putative [Plasmodium knowlesi strain H]SBO20108.1 dipeptidyl aminopeptidase 1, putative [Plasmodium knowlesi strain H]SBO20666.1 dipeptidyl aminopeptidase 1, putative [Plasmodium knowlesi strain H]VVS77665.1 dipeptidyl aminopeptidase 1, putative [Plasmodium knowlesi strain H]|eukprot:XP_002259168.1 Cathepsin c precursor, putative [Plasmodium knowlesi strain H]
MGRARNILSFGLILLHTLYLNLTTADIPAHVEIKNLVGKWKIQRTQTSPKMTTCGSHQPNNNIFNVKITDYKKYLLDNHYKFTSDLYVILSDDFVPYGDMHDTTGNEHRKNWKVLVVYDEHKRKIGTWTTICDEGFEIRLGNETYTAFMHYEPTGKCGEAKEDDQTDSNGETDCYTTNYNKIRFGWVDINKSKDEKLYGCFYAERYHVSADPSDIASTQQNISNEASVDSFLNSHNFLYPATSAAMSGSNDKPTFTKRKNMHIDQNSELYWHKMKHHGKKKPISREMMMNAKQRYACPCNKDEHVQDEVNNGDNPDQPVSPVSPVSLMQLGNRTGDDETNEMDLENYEDTEKSPHRELEIDELPKNFTWGDPFNKNTREYDVTNQLLCGSCYIASQMYVFKRRIEIGLTKNLDKKYLNNFDDLLSIQTVLSCSFYDQGCNGGYPYLVAKMAKLQGIPLDKVFPYTATEQTCPYKVDQFAMVTPAAGSNPSTATTKNLRQINAVMFSTGTRNDMHANFKNPISDDPEKWYAKDYNYIGGCYGCNQCNGEKIMMNEIYRNGPIVASFEATPDFYDYADGVYYVKNFPHARKCTVDATKKNFVYNVTGWEKVNHAIVLVGWGEEEIDGTMYKYWIGRNSWGKNWGKEGYFKIIRGLNFSGIESQTLFIEPDFTRGAGKILLEKLKNE